MKRDQPATCGRYSSAKVVLPAPFGPAMIQQVGIRLSVIRGLASADFYLNFAGREILHEAESSLATFLAIPYLGRNDGLSSLELEGTHASASP